MRVFNEIAVVTTICIKSIPQRFWASFSTVVAVGLVVTVLLAFLAMAAGFQQTLRGTGAKDMAILMRAGSQAELNSGVTRDQARLIEEAPGVMKDADGKPLVSPELYVIVDGVKKTAVPADGNLKKAPRSNLTLRGLGPAGIAVRPDLKIVEGRAFKPGTNELMVGRALQKDFAGLNVGNTVKLGNSNWLVVGAFELGGSVFESELWADTPEVQDLFHRQNVFQSIRARLTGPDALKTLSDYAANDPQLKLDVTTEADYYAQQASRTSDLIQKLGWPLAIAMAFGALAGALNTMYSSVAARAQEIATLRCIGFSGTSSFIGTLLESLVLALMGGIVGTLVTWVLFDGLTGSTLSGASFSQIVFTFHLTPAVALQGIILALVVGLVGGVFPAWRAARIPIVEAYGTP
ncbi:putative ABC transport system permease protein [Nitrospirillum amazonense]|uniref:Putative ABC transport system permease protein n=1 Tax=Nitrospirillum amazonense TaxID=28077 RepID=A0A560FNR3_9PROT|nr:ABC transporter permease [Nitrospirillum amazonense]TWB23256.1 putative ABC transport system permease protein [Nitrospirillum amazonense]